MAGKKIILLSDGTGNSAAAVFRTNVFRLYQALDLSLKDQVVFYDDGVGTSTFKPLAMLGGAFGFGLKRNVLDLYVELSRTYQPGDKLYMFGFSRGAFTIRILAGLILKYGLVPNGGEADMRKNAAAAFRQYRRDYRRKSRVTQWLLSVFRAIRDQIIALIDKASGRERVFGLHRGRIEIRFMGLWDTVAAYGLPIDELTRAWDVFFPLSIPDRDLHKDVLKACHALALDDERNTFHPVLWNEALDGIQTDIQSERVTQVWFAGMHSNVGGGYPLDGLAYITLDWMMSQVSDTGPLGPNGLRFNANEHAKVKLLADPDAPMADSRQGLGGTYRYRPRKLAEVTLDTRSSANPLLIPRIKIHESVMARIASGVTGYAPIVLPERYSVVTGSGAIVDMPSTAKPARPPVPIEHVAQAQSRANAQEAVWNRVWAKRVAYFSSILMALLLLAMPIMLSSKDSCTSWGCFLSPAIEAAGSFLPGFAEPWLTSFRYNPSTFIVIAGLILVLVGLGENLKTRIEDDMRPLLAPLGTAGGKPPAVIAPLPDNALFRLRTSRSYQTAFSLLKRVIMPSLAGVAALLLVLAGLNRSLVSVVASAGGFCEKAPDTYDPELRFDTRSPCWTNGAVLQEGKRYKITLTVTQPWVDKRTATGPLGSPMQGQPAAASALVLLRRQINRFWFQPIARVGDLGDDEYPLYPDNWALPTGTETTVTAEITPKRTGALYLYVNDLILPFGTWWQPGYANNQGAAQVTISPAPTSAGPKARTASVKGS